MNKAITTFLVVTAICGAAVAAGAAKRFESYTVVLLRDLDKSKEYKVMTTSERLQLQGEIAKESRSFPRAFVLADKEWRKSSTTANKPFPRNAIVRRNLKVVGTFSRLNDAEGKALTYTEREEGRELRKAEKEEDKLKRLGGGKGGRAKRDLLARKQASEAKKRAKRLELETIAIKIFREHLAKLVAAAENRKPDRGGS